MSKVTSIVRICGEQSQLAALAGFGACKRDTCSIPSLRRVTTGHIIHEAFETAAVAAEIAAGRPCQPTALSGLVFLAPPSLLGLVRFMACALPQQSTEVRS